MKLAGVKFELEHCAIAVFSDADDLKAATDELDRFGFEYIVLEGETGQESLQPKTGWPGCKSLEAGSGIR